MLTDIHEKQYTFSCWLLFVPCFNPSIKTKSNVFITII